MSLFDILALCKKGEIALPQRKTGLKDLRKNKRRHLHNLQLKTNLRKTIKNFLKLVDQNKSKEAQTALKTVYKKIDKAVKKNLIKKNTASRRKSKFSHLALAKNKA